MMQRTDTLIFSEPVALKGKRASCSVRFSSIKGIFTKVVTTAEDQQQMKTTDNVQENRLK